MQYAKIIDQAWKITWKHKVLWIFGILSACNSGSSASSDSSYNFLGDSSIILLLACCFAIIIFAISVFGYFALIKGILKITEEETPTFRELLSYGQDYFWRGAGLSLAVTAIILIPVIGLVIIFVFTGIDPSLGFIISLICILVPVFFLLYIFIAFASISLVDRESNITDAIVHGFNLTKDNLGAVLGLGLALLVLYIIIFILLAIPVFIFAQFVPFTSVDSSLFLLCLFGLLPLALAFAGMAESFTTSIWTLAYLELRDEPSEAAEASV